MDAVRSSWTDERLEDFRDDVNRRFDDVDRRFEAVDRRFDTVDRRIDALTDRVTEMDARLTGRIDSLQHLMVQGFIAIMAAMFTGFAGLAALIVTQT
jgi:hypothetical protein